MYYIVVYENTSDAICAERKLKEENINFKVMPTPTAITHSCGMCSRFEMKEELDKVINNNLVKYKNIYSKNNNEFVLIK